jgi:hypothetical protein
MIAFVHKTTLMMWMPLHPSAAAKLLTSRPRHEGDVLPGVSASVIAGSGKTRFPQDMGELRLAGALVSHGQKLDHDPAGFFLAHSFQQVLVHEAVGRAGEQAVTIDQSPSRSTAVIGRR